MGLNREWHGFQVQPRLAGGFWLRGEQKWRRYTLPAWEPVTGKQFGASPLAGLRK